MSDNATRKEKPTGKRLQQFREKGDIAQSRDLIAVSALFGGTFLGALMVQRSAAALSTFATSIFGNLDGISLGDALPAMGRAFTEIVWPTALGAVGGAIVLGGVQFGWPPPVRFPRLSFKFFSPEALLKVFGVKEFLTRTLMSGAKFAVVAIAAYVAVKDEYTHFMAQPALDAASLLERMASAIGQIAKWTIGALLVLASLDFMKAKFSWLARVKMTKEEVKREHKDQEGSPEVKGRRRRRMREIAKQRIAAVPKADVVIVNPTHFAVALKYVAGKDRAPRVVAKGKDGLAQRIRDVARRAGVPIVPDPPLARMLFKLVPEGRMIPATLFKAVAEVLAYVYRLRRRVG